MHGGVGGNADAYRRKFRVARSRSHPDAGAPADPHAVNAERPDHVDQHPFEGTDVRDDIARLRKPQNRVSDQLTGTVPGDLAPAVDIDNRDVANRSLVRLGAFAGGVDGLVLEQQHGVWGLALAHRSMQVVLLGEAIGVRHQPTADAVNEDIDHRTNIAIFWTQYNNSSAVEASTSRSSTGALRARGNS